MLTATAIKALAPRPAKYEHMDPDNPGFGIAVSPNGAKAYIYRYRIGGRGGTLRRITLGKVGSTSLKNARDAYHEARKQMDAGTDPLEAKAEARRQEEQDLTFGKLAEQYLAQYAAQKRTGAEDERILNHDVLPKWAKLKAKGIKKRDVVALLDKIVERGATTQANRTFACIRKVFNWAAQKDLVESSPCAGIKAPAKENARDQVLTDEEIRQFWTLPGLSARMQAALRLQLLLAQRIGEVVGMRWSEIDDGNRLWTLPAERAKNKVVHTIPLTALALDILETLRDLHGLRDDADTNDFVFPAARGQAEHLRVDSIGTALTRAIKEAGIAHFTPHDLRRTAATRISGAGTTREVLRQILNHKDNSVTARYDRHRYDNEKREALEGWAVRLGEIVDGQ
jgi:integrase